MEKNDLVNNLIEKGFRQTIEEVQLNLIGEIQRRVENMLQGGMNKKEFAQWFGNTIIELKQQVSDIPTYKRW